MGRKIAVHLLGVVFFQVLSGLLLAADTNYPACSKFGIQPVSERKAAPPFTLKTVEGVQTSLNEFKGKPLIFTFWASWCETCRDEIPLIEKFSQGKKSQVSVLLIAIDGENEKRIQRIIQGKNITLPVLLDVREKTARAYGIRMVPTTFFVSAEGIIVGTVVGEREWAAPEAWSATKELFAIR